MEDNNKTVTVELTDEQYAFLTNWQKTHEAELGIEVPLTAMVRKAIDGTMKAQQARAERDAAPRPPRRDGPSKFGDRKPGFGDRKPGGFGSDRGGRSSGGRFGDKPKSRPLGGRGPKFDMLGGKNKRTKTFED